MKIYTFSSVKTWVKVSYFSRFSESWAGSVFWYQTDFPVGILSFSLCSLSVFLLSAAITVYELSGCCTFVWTSPYFQREARLYFTLLINEKFNWYRRCLGKGHTGVKAKHSAFTPPACFHSQESWIWVWSIQLLLSVVLLLQSLWNALSI